MRSPKTEQGCYDLGYESPKISSRDFEWMHLVDVNAFRCGQLDRQNHAPRNHNYKREDMTPRPSNGSRLLFKEKRPARSIQRAESFGGNTRKCGDKTPNPTKGQW